MVSAVSTPQSTVCVTPLQLNVTAVVLERRSSCFPGHAFTALLPTEDRFNLVSAERLIFITSYHSVFLTVINRQSLYKSLRGKVPVKNYYEA